MSWMIGLGFVHVRLLSDSPTVADVPPLSSFVKGKVKAC